MAGATESSSGERLLVEAAQADPRRFADLYELHFDRVYAYTARRLRDRTAAQDVTSDVFHHALANLHRYEWRGIPFVTWLYRIASNRIFDYRQEQAKQGALIPPPVEESEPEDYEEVELRARLFAAVRRLPEDQRRVIEMRFAQEQSIRDVAEALQRSEGAIKQLQKRATDTLRALLGEVVDHG